VLRSDSPSPYHPQPTEPALRSRFVSNFGKSLDRGLRQFLYQRAAEQKSPPFAAGALQMLSSVSLRQFARMKDASVTGEAHVSVALVCGYLGFPIQQLPMLYGSCAALTSSGSISPSTVWRVCCSSAHRQSREHHQADCGGFAVQHHRLRQGHAARSVLLLFHVCLV
jgi:hypothetical protein